MKKTVTTILSLALAMILVSSLGNGVTYAHGKKKYKTVKVHDVVIISCKPDLTVGFFSGSADVDPELVPMVGMTCTDAIAKFLGAKFRTQTIIADFLLGPTYTLVNQRKVRVLLETEKKDEDD